ncbi:MAG: hypothetical protein V3T31_10605, partial [candidate division Zixibacteria bacterium]
MAARDLQPKSKYDSHSTRPNIASSARPVIEYAGHGRGRIRLAVANNGTFGTEGRSVLDPVTGELIPSCEYPKNSEHVFLWVGAFWIGAVVGRDTLVSVGTEDFYVTQE